MDFYLLAVIVLVLLAVCDLMVGVSNDAVNFLNSAVGSRVASRKTILVVVSLGILVGATFSSGMMEVARKGIFNPSEYYLSEIMVIFLAVMITDVILLDMFNTFGMPTSTTVSIVFELLGASVAVALLKMAAANDANDNLGNYINSDKALLIIAGILLSVVVAFTVGVIVQYVSRVLFSFHYERRLKWFGAAWAGLAMAAMTHFLLVKGLKGASFVSDDMLKMVSTRPAMTLAMLFVFFAAGSQVLLWLRVEILRIVVLFGTFSLAMAFAGNDLVNFIGVPVAGMESYRAWSASQQPADSFAMTSLTEPVRTNSFLLLCAGGIMVITLWFSKKARTVTDTEVNLGRQTAGFERFSPHSLARAIVRLARDGGQVAAASLPENWRESLETNFATKTPSVTLRDPPAFDLVRASVNLAVASSLIAIATSKKLPLSTTYVSFMVAMGTSLADRAWDRESAVYRVSGVLNVIGGWFFTAAAAFLMAAVLAVIIHTTGSVGVVTLVGAAAYAIWRTFHLHKEREDRKQRRLAPQQTSTLAFATAIDETTKGTAEVLTTVRESYHDAVEALFCEQRSLVKRARRELRKANEQNDFTRLNLHHYMTRVEESRGEGSRIYLMYYDLTHDMLQSLKSVVSACHHHVANCHYPPTPDQTAMLTRVRQQVESHLQHVSDRLRVDDFSDISAAISGKNMILRDLDTLFEQHVRDVKQQHVGVRNTEVMLRLLLDSKDLVAIATRFLKFYHRHLSEHGDHRESAAQVR